VLSKEEKALRTCRVPFKEMGGGETREQDYPEACIHNMRHHTHQYRSLE